MSKIETLNFLSPTEIPNIADSFGTPVFVYDLETIKNKFEYMNSIPSYAGLRIRYSVKANPNRTILKLYDQLGSFFDVSSIYEAKRLLSAGIRSHKILMTAQEMSYGWEEIIANGVEFDAGSLNQLEAYGREFPGTSVSVRVNPGFGSGLVKKLTSGGCHSSFGIWVDYLDEILAIAGNYSLNINRLHFHIGSGHETAVLEKTVELALDIMAKISTVGILNLGGGYKISALQSDPIYNHHAMGNRLSQALEKFHVSTNRKIKLELEPGTFLMALSGSIISRVIDTCDTGKNGYQFLKIDGGLTEVMRPSYYGSLHPLVTIGADGKLAIKTKKYMVSGHCCIAGDTLTIENGSSEEFCPMLLASAKVGDFVVIERSGGYATSMAVKNFNSYPESPEVLRLREGKYELIRARQTMEDIIKNEIDVQLENLL